MNKWKMSFSNPLNSEGQEEGCYHFWRANRRFLIMWPLISPINFNLWGKTKPFSQNYKLRISMIWITKLLPSCAPRVFSVFDNDGNLQFDKDKCIFTTMAPPKMHTSSRPSSSRVSATVLQLYLIWTLAQILEHVIECQRWI